MQSQCGAILNRRELLSLGALGLNRSKPVCLGDYYSSCRISRSRSGVPSSLGANSTVVWLQNWTDGAPEHQSCLCGDRSTSLLSPAPQEHSGATAPMRSPRLDISIHTLPRSMSTDTSLVHHNMHESPLPHISDSAISWRLPAVLIDMDEYWLSDVPELMGLWSGCRSRYSWNNKICGELCIQYLSSGYNCIFFMTFSNLWQ